MPSVAMTAALAATIGSGLYQSGKVHDFVLLRYVANTERALAGYDERCYEPASLLRGTPTHIELLRCQDEKVLIRLLRIIDSHPNKDAIERVAVVNSKPMLQSASDELRDLAIKVPKVRPVGRATRISRIDPATGKRVQVVIPD